MRIRWLSLCAALAVVVVNVAGIWQITAARRAAEEEGARIFRIRTSSRASELESALASVRADLAFLAGSSALDDIERAIASRDPVEARWRRNGAEGALLLFLRGHPIVQHVVLRGEGERVLFEAGRRGGAPVLWKPDAGPGASEQGSQVARPGRNLVSTSVTVGQRLRFSQTRPAPVARIEAEVEGKSLLSPARADQSESFSCHIEDPAGQVFLFEDSRAQSGVFTAGGRSVLGDAPILAEDWSVPTPWRLVCDQSGAVRGRILEPLASRYRVSLALNLAVMGLAIALGAFGLQQVRRRERLEATAREEARVLGLERQLFHSERLSTVGRLAAGMAHEINNPLEGISNYLTLASDSLDRNDAGSARRYLGSASEGVERAAGVVRQVLAQADPAQAATGVVDLADVARRSVSFVGSRREFSGIRFETDVDRAGRTLDVHGNAVMLGQVVLNLLINACEAQPAGGDVRIGGRIDGSSVVLEVADRGPGLPPGEESRVFEPFFSTKRSTGLGLSICRSIVQQHGGSLSAAAREGGGALFTCTLPLAGSR